MLEKLAVGILTMALLGCQQSTTNSFISSQYQDTIYSKSASNVSKFKRPIIRLTGDSTNNSELQLIHGKKNYIRITVDNFKNRYPIYLINPENVLIEEINRKTGDFYLSPTDSICSFEVHLDFGTNNMLIAYKADSIGLTYNAYDSMKPLGRIVEKVIMPHRTN